MVTKRVCLLGRLLFPRAPRATALCRRGGRDSSLHHLGSEDGCCCGCLPLLLRLCCSRYHGDAVPYASAIGAWRCDSPWVSFVSLLSGLGMWSLMFLYLAAMCLHTHDRSWDHLSADEDASGLWCSLLAVVCFTRREGGTNWYVWRLCLGVAVVCDAFTCYGFRCRY